MADLFAEVARELPKTGTHGLWQWYSLLGMQQIDVWRAGIQIATLAGPYRYDYLVRLMAAEPHADA